MPGGVLGDGGTIVNKIDKVLVLLDLHCSGWRKKLANKCIYQIVIKAMKKNKALYGERELQRILFYTGLSSLTSLIREHLSKHLNEMRE